MVKTTTLFFIIFFIMALPACEIEKELDYQLKFSDKDKLALIGYATNNDISLFITNVRHPQYPDLETNMPEIDSIKWFADNIPGEKLQLLNTTYHKTIINTDLTNKMISVAVWYKNNRYIYSLPEKMPVLSKIDSVRYKILQDKLYGQFYFMPEKHIYYSYQIEKGTTEESSIEFMPISNPILVDTTSYNFPLQNDFVIENLSLENDSAMIRIVLKSLSKNTWIFESDLNEYINNQEDMFSESNIILTNVINGKGFFGCYQADTLLIKLPNNE